MEFHHDKHHLTYVTNINKALEGKDQPPLVELQKSAIKSGPAFRNSGGGTYNHNFFWQEMAPKGKGGSPSEKLAAAINDAFGSMDDFKAKFEAAGAPAASNFALKSSMEPKASLMAAASFSEGEPPLPL